MVVLSQNINHGTLTITLLNHVKLLVNELDGNGIEILAQIRLPSQYLGTYLVGLLSYLLHNHSTTDSLTVCLAAGVDSVRCKFKQQVIGNT